MDNVTSAQLFLSPIYYILSITFWFSTILLGVEQVSTRFSMSCESQENFFVLSYNEDAKQVWYNNAESNQSEFEFFFG